MSAACGCPTVVLLGNRPALAHDPKIRSVLAPRLHAITVQQVCEVCNNACRAVASDAPALATA